MIGPSYGNPKLLSLARHIPKCAICGVWNQGQVVGAHSNRLADGKGKGIKAHDLVAYVCGTCHAELDGAGDRNERHAQFLQAFYDSMLMALREGLIKVTK